MKFFVSLIVATFVLTGAALADPLTNYYGNTLKIIDHPDNTSFTRTRTMYIDADGGTATTYADGTVIFGAWAINGDQVCFRYVNRSMDVCWPATAHNVGYAWAVPSSSYRGAIEHVSLFPGR